MQVVFSERLFEYLVMRRKAEVNGRHVEFLIEFNDVISTNDGNMKVEISGVVPGDFYDLRDGEISFHPHPENQGITPNGKWSRDGRLTMKPGKFLNLLQKNVLVRVDCYFSNNDWCAFDANNEELKKFFIKYAENFSAAVKGTKITLDLKISEDPSAVYSIPTFFDNQVGTLGTSCMRPESNHTCHNGSPIYSQWGGKIVYATKKHYNNDYLICRAHLWENTVCDDGTIVTFLDRVYANEVNTEQMLSFAENNGWWWKISQDSHSCGITDGRNVKYVEYREINPWIQKGICPYMDTFISVDETRLYAKLDKGLFNLQNTSARFLKTLRCPRCNNPFVEENGIVYNGELHCCDCIRYDNWNGNIPILVSDAIRYYDATGNAQFVHRAHTHGLTIVNHQGSYRLYQAVIDENIRRRF